MALKARIDELTSRHRALDTAIDDEQKSAATDAYRVNAMKKEKLRLKDQIAELSAMAD